MTESYVALVGLQSKRCLVWCSAMRGTGLNIEMFDNVLALVERMEEGTPDCLFVHSELLNRDGAEVLSVLRRFRPSLQMYILCDRHYPLSEVVLSMRHGAQGVFYEHVHPDQLINSVPELVKSA